MNENNLTRNELSALVPQYPSNFSDTNHSPLTTHHSLKRKFAFTLAEVLITLGIIGVVAALTLPSFIQNYQKKLVETRLKETYSILSQMMQYAIAENGESVNWVYPKYGDQNYNEADFFEKYLAKHVKVMKTCEHTINNVNNYQCRTHHSDLFKTQSGDKVNWSNMAEGSKKYILANGTSFYFDTIWGNDHDPNPNGPDYYGIIFVVDLNINKNNALLGRDIFLFIYNEITEKLMSSRYMDMQGHDRSCSTLQNNRAAVINECRTGDFGVAGGGYDGGCTTLIMCNGFAIPDDYPIKF